jgi:microsomal dipeptidase-like Zn-dependent dipeptidase
MLGFADLHNHQFANLGFGGLAFWGKPYGTMEEALPWCGSVHGPGGAGDLLGNLLRSVNYGTGLASAFGHKVGGNPEFDGWPRWDSITHQAVYADWLQRAVTGGLRLMVMLAVNNEFLCGLARKAPGRTCLDMEAVDLQLSAAKDMEAFIDLQCGGSGRGWYRIVRTPHEAAQVISEGKLAVILGIEVDYPFDSRPGGGDLESSLSEYLDRYFDLGVRYVFPIHFADNAFGGTAFQNALIYSKGSLAGSAVNPLGTLGVYAVDTEDGSDLGYTYRGGRRNKMGLSKLGVKLIHGLLERGIVIDIDHMSAHAKWKTMDICQSEGYPVVSGHSGLIGICKGEKRHEGQLTDREIDRIRELGGMVSLIARQGGLEEIATAQTSYMPHACGATANSFVQAYTYAVQRLPGEPIAIGTDFNGFAGLPGPRFGNDSCPGGKGAVVSGAPVSYPFRASAAAGLKMWQSRIGDKEFDINTEGLAHVGMLPDFIADLEAMGVRGSALEPLMSSAAGFLRVWESAWKVAGKAD